MESINNYSLNKKSSVKIFAPLENETVIEKSEMQGALDKWAEGLLSISHAYANQEDYNSIAKKVLEKNYAFGQSEVLFKPTLASVVAFRTTLESALSYFIGGNKKYSEDRGFALTPWVKVDFEIAGAIEGEKQGIIMGNKILKQLNGTITIANFTMGFIKSPDGELKINVHHSSLPYKPV